MAVESPGGAGIAGVTPLGAAASVLGAAASTPASSASGAATGGGVHIEGLRVGGSSDNLVKIALIGAIGLSAVFLFRK